VSEKIFFHQAILDDLKELLNKDQLPHALILSGKDGSGHLELGLKLAQEIVSSQLPNPSPEKMQSAAHKAAKHIHPDIHFSFPFIGPTTSNDFLKEWREALNEDVFMNITQWMMRLDAENKQANINAKECHSIIQKLGLKSFESEYKVLLMWLPEYLGKEGNRLLKLIEEPPENTVFILVTENIDRILNTILSRCQLVKVISPSDEEVARRLVEENGLTEAAAKKISFLAEGNYRLARNMSDDNIIDYSEKLFEWLRTCYKLKPEEIVNWCDGFGKLKKEQQKYFVTYALQFFRSFLMLDVLDKDHLRFLEKEITVAQNLKKFIDLDALENIEELLNDSFMMIERNASVKMLFMKNSIRIHEMFHTARLA
jgi:DNA polymerase-3 subunit delta'